MTYRELLKLYKAGSLDQETKEKIEKDIEKQDAISDYLFDEENTEEEMTEEKNEMEETGENTLALIQKSIRKAFVKMGMMVGAAVLSVLLLCIFVLPSLVSLFFYNPNQTVGKDPRNEALTTSRMDLDMTVYSEMFLPGQLRTTVIAENEGWGNYRITVPQTNSFDGLWHTAEGYLSRNHLDFYTPDVLKLPSGNVFFLPPEVKNSFNMVDGDTDEKVGPQGKPGEAMQALEELDENSWYTAYVSLKDITSYEDFISWYLAADPFSAYTWCAVYTDTGDQQLLGSNMGFAIRCSAEYKHWDEKAYPHLTPLSFDAGKEEEAVLHFTSMLTYLRDHPQILSMMNRGTVSYHPDFFDLMLESIEKDGLRLYGFAIQTKKDTLLSLSKDPRVSYIYTTRVN